MNEHLSYSNVLSNPKAAYLFIEEGKGYSGKRLYLSMTGEDTDEYLIKSVSKRSWESDKSSGAKHLVYFAINMTRPLVGE